ncbi:MAG: hypothetical protein ACXAC2_23030, partial [Candidatus Kariarchaeaceae archaeon]
IQDIERLEESYQYFVDILQILKNVDPSPKLYVLFHKYDPEISGRLKSHFYKAARLFRKADKLTPQKFKFYLTSIYSNSIDLAVKRILFENFEDFEEPSQKLSMDRQEPSQEPSVPVPSTTSTVSNSQVVPQPTAQTTTPPPPTTSASTTPKEESFEVRTSVSGEKPKAPEPLKTKADLAAKSEPVVPKIEVPPSPTTDEVAEIKQVTEADKEDVKEATTADEAELVEATPSSLFDLSDELVDKLTQIVDKRMKETDEIVALSILSTEGKQVLAIGKNDIDYERLETLKEVVATLNPKQFYKELSDIEYRGLGHFTLSDFDIYFARANQDYAIAILAVDVSTLMLQNAQRIVDSIRQGLGMMDVSEEVEPEVKKKDLVSDLRSRLKKLSSLSDLDKE